MTYKRYNFNDQEQAESKIDAFYDTNEEGDKVLTQKAHFIKLGKFVETPAELDEDFNEVTPAVMTDGYAVDVLWEELEESPYGWLTYEVEPTNPKHTIF